MSGSAERLYSPSLAGKGLLEAHALVAPPLLLTKEPHIQRCAGLGLLAELLQGAGKRGYRSLGLGIAGQAVVWALGQEALDAGFPTLRPLVIFTEMPLDAQFMPELDFLPIVNPNMKIFHLSMSTFCPPCIRLES